MHIRNIDVSAYPEITVTVELAGAAASALDTLEVQESLQVQPHTRYDHAAGPIDLAVLLDLSAAGQDKIPLIAALVQSLTAGLPANTRYALFAPTADGRTAQPIPLGVSYGNGPFYTDRNAFNDTLLRFTPTAPDDTALIEQLTAIEQQFPAGDASRHILVFTGPVATSGTSDLAGLQPGCAAGLRVHPVLVAADKGTGANSPLLEQLAIACNGVNTDLTAAGQGQSLLQAMPVPAVYDLVYRSRSRIAGPIGVFVQAPGGGTFSDVLLGTTFPPSSLALTVTTPLSGAEFATTSAIEVSAVAEAAPAGVRVITATYSLNGGPATAIATPGRDLSFVLPPQVECRCLLQVDVFDELGNQASTRIAFQVAAAASAPAAVETDTPAPGDTPIATPGATATPSLTERFQQAQRWAAQRLPLLGGLLALVAMVGLSLTGVMARRAAQPSPGGKTVDMRPGKEGKNTQPAPAPAILQAEEQLPGMPRVIKLNQEKTVVGRDRITADVKVTDDRVSNRHCTIRRENSRYTVEDHGSMNGTWVNDTPVSGANAQLEHGDILKIGPASYRFLVSARARSGAPPEHMANGIPYARTQALANLPATPKEGEQ